MTLTGIDSSIDGKPFVSKDFPVKMSPDAMPDGGTKKDFMLGNGSLKEQTLIDEFVAYKGSIKNNLGFCWRIFRMDYHGAKEESAAADDKRQEERQPLGTGIHAFVFCVASPFIRRGELRVCARCPDS